MTPISGIHRISIGISRARHLRSAPATAVPRQRLPRARRPPRPGRRPKLGPQGRGRHRPEAVGPRAAGSRGRQIPWESISAVTAVQYWDHANLQLRWDRADLNRALILHLDEPLDVPRITVKDGAARLRIPLLRYPTVAYRPLYRSMLEEFARRGIPVRTGRKPKET